MAPLVYENYTTQAFLDDPFFIKWVRNNSEEAHEFWHNWIQSQPGNLPAMREAEKQLRYIFSLQRIAPDTGDTHEVWNQISQRIQPLQKTSFLKSPWIKWVAAASVIFIVIGYYFLAETGNPLIRVSSAYGTVKRLRLSDSSLVILNGNSSISFNKRWKQDSARELWLDGEGFFEVKHLDTDHHVTQHERFLVHVKNIVIEVLGTSFDVRYRRNKLEVVLQTGSIKITLPDKSRTSILLKPSEMIALDLAHPESITYSTTEPQHYTGWTQRKLILKNASIQEVIRYIEDNYGKKIILADASLQNRKIQGTILLDNLDDVMFVLSKVLNITITTKNDATILFTPK